MNLFLKNLGILVVILGACLLGYYMSIAHHGNGILIAAGVMMIGGIALHVILNRIFD